MLLLLAYGWCLLVFGCCCEADCGDEDDEVAQKEAAELLTLLMGSVFAVDVVDGNGEGDDIMCLRNALYWSRLAAAMARAAAAAAVDCCCEAADAEDKSDEL